MSSLDDSSEQRLARLASEAVRLLRACKSPGSHRYWMLPRVLAIQREEFEILKARAGLRSMEAAARLAGLGRLG